MARKLAAQGEVHPVLQREPPLPPHLLWQWARFHELGSDESGRKSLGDMMLLLDEYGITDHEERTALRALWWEMNAVELDVSEKIRKASEPKMPRAR